MREDIQAKIDAVNAAHGYANRLAPILLDYFGAFVGSKILKADGTLLKKLVLPTFPADPATPGITIGTYRLQSTYSLGWVVKSCRRIPPHSCLYYETTIYVGNLSGDVLKDVQTWTPRRADYNRAELDTLIREYEAAKALADAARGRIDHPFTDFVR